MISHRHKCIFVHIRKTAGNSIRNILGDCDGESSGLHFHDHLSHHKKYLSEQQFSEYFKFTFVRNPWDSRVSLYKYLANGGHGSLTRYANRLTFKDWVKRYSDRVKVNTTHTGRTQLSYIKPIEDMDFVGKLENLQEDFNIICDKIGIPSQELPHHNKSKPKHKHYTEYYDDETRQIVAEKYAKDIEYFGYEFGE
jgi:hypothetical protein